MNASPLVDHIMDAQAANAVQGRALGSAVEHALFLLKTANDVQRPHAVALVRDLKAVVVSNTAERASERAAAGVADPITSVHEFAKLARPVLADLMNPIMPQRRVAARLGELHALFVRTSPRTRSAFCLRELLGVAKYTRLVAELAAWTELQVVECAA